MLQLSLVAYALYAALSLSRTYDSPMGFATIVAVLSFFIALLALWLTSDVIKKVENQNEKFVRAHISSIREELRDMDAMLHKVTRLSKRQDEGQSALDTRLNDHTKALDHIGEHLRRVNEQVDELDRSILPRYRVRTVKNTVKAAAKPSIQ